MAPPRAVLFDLDGTLLAHDIDAFMPRYIAAITASYRRALGLEILEPMIAAVRRAMRANGEATVGELYFDSVCRALGHDRARLSAIYDDFLATEAEALCAGLSADPSARAAVETARALGAKVACATQPVFPRRFIEIRLGWAGVAPSAFDLITHLETARYCKPHPAYFRSIAEALGVPLGDCLMVGNDLAMDLASAAQVGMQTCLVDGPFAERNVEGFAPTHAVPLSGLSALLRGL